MSVCVCVCICVSLSGTKKGKKTENSDLREEGRKKKQETSLSLFSLPHHSTAFLSSLSFTYSVPRAKRQRRTLAANAPSALYLFFCDFV